MVMQELKGLPLEPVTMYRPDHDTVWGYGSGMTVLLIEDGAHLHKFYLDRAVRLRSGVRFGFAPLQGSSCIYRQADLPPSTPFSTPAPMLSMVQSAAISLSAAPATALRLWMPTV